MRPQNTETSTCYMLPEMVDVGVADMAEEADLRAAVSAARRAADAATPCGSAWPVEPGSLAEAVYWHRRLAGQGSSTRPEDVMAALSNLGYTWGMDRRWGEAESAFRECLQLHRQYGDRAGLGQTFFDVGSLYQAQQRWTEAEPAFAQALEIARELGDRRGAANALGHLGLVCAALGQLEKAVGYGEQSLAIARELGDQRRAANALGRLGVVYAATSQDDKAVAHLQQAVAIAEQLGDESLTKRMREHLARVSQR